MSERDVMFVERKLLKDIEAEKKFSFKKIVKLIQLNAIYSK